jgi:hypothetical protein
MSSATTIEERLAALEQAVADLRRQVPAAPKANWVQQVIGSVTDLEAFDEALRIGREYRQAQVPDVPAGEQP